MSQLLLKGGSPLEGEVTIQGAKNSVLPILAATLLTKERVILRGCPPAAGCGSVYPDPAGTGL